MFTQEHTIQIYNTSRRMPAHDDVSCQQRQKQKQNKNTHTISMLRNGAKFHAYATTDAIFSATTAGVESSLTPVAN